jgi:hypothetical protein
VGQGRPEGRGESHHAGQFMFVVLPLKVPRGTGSPVNPIAVF